MMCVILYTLCKKVINPISIDTNSLLQRLPERFVNSRVTDLIVYIHHIHPNQRPNSKQCFDVLNNMLSTDRSRRLKQRPPRPTRKAPSLKNRDKVMKSKDDLALQCIGKSLHTLDDDRPKTER